MSGAKQDVEGTVGEFQEFDGRIGLVLIQIRGEVCNNMTQ